MRRLILAVATLVAASSCSFGGTAELAGYERLPTPNVGHLSLEEQGHGEFSFVAEEGRLLIVYFGYTNCPDVCPTTLTDVARALKEMDSDDADRIDLAMISIDPDRDTGELIASYTTSFVDRGHGLRTDDAEVLAAVAAEFGAAYSVEEVPGEEPEVGHTASLYAVDSAGDLVLTWSFGVPPTDLASDMSQLLKG